MREILKTGVKNYNNSKETTENQTKEKKREEENTLISSEISTFESQNKAIEFLLRKETDSVLENNFT